MGLKYTHMDVKANGSHRRGYLGNYSATSLVDKVITRVTGFWKTGFMFCLLRFWRLLTTNHVT